MSLDQIQLETSGKGEHLKKEEAVVGLESITDVKQYLAKLSAKDGANRLKNPEIQKQIMGFLEKSANNGLSKNLEKFNAKKFDTDGEKGLDRYEFENFSKTLKGAIVQIVALDSVGAFERVHNESKEIGWSTPDKWVAEKVDIGKNILGEKGSSSFIEAAIKNVGNFSPEELHKISEKPFSLSVESMKDLSILLAKEVGSGVEDLLRFLTNIPAGLVLLPRYLTYRAQSYSSDIQQETEADIKLAGLTESNMSLAIMDLIGEKGAHMITELGRMMKSGKQGDIATILVMIAGLIAGGAGAVRLLSTMARKSAINGARKAGSIGRTVEGRVMRNTLKNASHTAGKVAAVANKVDNIISGAGIGHIAGMAATGIKKVAPSLGSAANDAQNMSEIERARAQKQAKEKELADAVSTMEMQGTGTHGPATGPRMSANPYDGRSTESLQDELAYMRSFRDDIDRRGLTPNEGKILQEINRRNNPNTPHIPPATVTPIHNTPREPHANVDIAEKLAGENARFVENILFAPGAKVPPMLYIIEGGNVLIGEFKNMNQGKVVVEFLDASGISQKKSYKIEDIAGLNDLEKRLSPLITPEIRARRAKMEQAYAKSGISPLEVQRNARLGPLESIGKAEQLLGRSLDQWEKLAIEHIHKNISKGIYNNSSGNLQKMYDTWESMTHHKRTTDIAQNKAQYAEFRKLVKNGILGTDSPISTPSHTPSTGKTPDITKQPDAFRSPEITGETERILGEINKRGDTDFLEALLSGKPINQPQLNALVHEYSSTHGLDPAKLHTFIKDIFEISGYVGNQNDMYAHAIAFSKEKAMRGLLGNLTSISATDMVAHLSNGLQASGDLLQAFLKNGSPSAKEAFLQILIENDTLRVNILGSNKIEDLLQAISENTQHLGKLVSSIITDQSLMKRMAPEHLKRVGTILEKMIQENSFNGGLIETLRTKLAFARDAKSPKNRIANFLQNGDDTTAKLLGAEFSSERLAWNMMFEDYRLVDNGNMKQLNMLMRGESKFFHGLTLDNFFHSAFWDLEKSVQKEFLKNYVIPENGKYHSILEKYPKFRETLENQRMI